MTNSVKSCLILLLAALVGASPAWRLRIVHVNDIHAHLDPTEVSLRCDPPAEVELGGAARLATAFAQLRRDGLPSLFLHAGDEFSGTPWFSSYLGLADAAALDRLGLDAFVTGNHEYDRGPAVLGRFLDSLHVPTLAANVDASKEPALAGKLRRGILIRRGGHLVGVVGVALPGTPGISSPGPTLTFRSASTARSAVDSLRAAGAELVVLLTHAGFDQDTVLARMPGVDVVVGGHTHTRMGDFGDEGLATKLPYPYMVQCGGRSVPVVQAWEWGKEIGVLDLEIRDGKVVSAQGHPFLPAGPALRAHGKALPESLAVALRERLEHRARLRFLAEDDSMASLLRGLEGPIDSLRHAVVGHLAQRLDREDGGLLHACAQALRLAGSDAGAVVGLMNPGGVREDLEAGAVTREQVLEVQPFGNAVVVLTVTARDLLQAVSRLSSRRGRGKVLDGAEVRKDADGNRQLVLEGGTVLEPEDTLRLATNSYLASGGDGCRSLKDASGWRAQLQTTDSQALEAWIRRFHP
jgi:5'-nucleotidase